MKLHIALARGLIRLGAFIQKSAVMVMTSDELVEFSRQHYAKLRSIEGWNRDDVVAEGLHPEELQLLERLPPRTGQLLLLGVGGGREAISFARMGFDVTGVDFIPEMVEGAIANAARYNVQIKGLVQDIAALDVPTEAYDVVWIFAGMYSCLPSLCPPRANAPARVPRTKTGRLFSLPIPMGHTPAIFVQRCILMPNNHLAHNGQPFV